MSLNTYGGMVLVQCALQTLLVCYTDQPNENIGAKTILCTINQSKYQSDHIPKKLPCVHATTTLTNRIPLHGLIKKTILDIGQKKAVRTMQTSKILIKNYLSLRWTGEHKLHGTNWANQQEQQESDPWTQIDTTHSKPNHLLTRFTPRPARNDESTVIEG